MPQNRNKLIDIFIGNLVNSVVHTVLEKAVKKERDYLADKYRKELINSLEIAKKYREKINPVEKSLPEKDISYIKERIIRKVKAELRIRILKGYENINLNVVEEEVNNALKEVKAS